MEHRRARTILFGTKTPYTARAMPDVTKLRDDRLLFAVLALGRVVFLVERFLWPGAVGEIRRRGLVSARRLGQRFPRRLALERRGLGLVAAEHAAEAAGVTELRRAQDRIVE